MLKLGSDFAIIGSGFGIYGYLPALLKCGQEIVMPVRYRHVVTKRFPKIAESPQVGWARDELSAIQSARGVILAVNPARQENWIKVCLEEPRLEHLCLEKPLARNPSIAREVHKLLCLSGKSFSLGYLFRYTKWYQVLARLAPNQKDGGQIAVRWKFRSNHYQNQLRNWKSDPSQGGGALRFYGIQIIACLAELGYERSLDSKTIGLGPGDAHLWKARFAGTNLADVDVEIDSNSKASTFGLFVRRRGMSRQMVSWRTPFQENFRPTGLCGTDPRVEHLVTLCQAREPASVRKSIYLRTLDLWDNVELVNQHLI